MNGLFQALACVGAPIDCGIGWLDSLPVLIVIAVSMLIGMIAGAHMGKPAVYGVVTLGLALLIFRKRDEEDHFPDPDKRPSAYRRAKVKPVSQFVPS